MFISLKIIELNSIQRLKSMFLLSMTLGENVSDVWILKQNNLLFLVMWCLARCHLIFLK